MTTAASLTRMPCATCRTETLHDSSTCVHCKTAYVPPRARDLVLDAMGNEVPVEAIPRGKRGRPAKYYRNGIERVGEPPTPKRGPGRPKKVAA